MQNLGSFSTQRKLSCPVNGSGHLLPSRNKWMSLNRKISCKSPSQSGQKTSSARSWRSQKEYTTYTFRKCPWLGRSRVIFPSVMPIWCNRTESWSRRLSEVGISLLNCSTLDIHRVRARWITFWNEFTVVRGMSAFALSHSLICAIRCWKSKHCPTSQ